MILGGLQRFSLIDYPGKISAIAFTRGCNFRCPYCHNPELVLPERFEGSLDERYALAFMEMRKGSLEALTITGGEPTLQKDLRDFIEKIREMGYLIKLDSNGTDPEKLKELMDERLVDYIAMDVKAPLEKYTQVVRVEVDVDKIKRSIELIKGSGIDHEFRTTVVDSLLTEEDIVAIGNLVEGADRYILQKFIPSKCLDSSYVEEIAPSDEKLAHLVERLSGMVGECYVR